MQFRVLGPLEVVRDGTPVAIGRGRRRALLAYLLLRANEVVPRERLIDELWGDEPPETAVNALQVQVHGLRRALGGDRLLTRGAAYELRVEPGELDLDRFEATGDPALWRGPALADVDAPFAERERARLDELRLTALERRIDDDLERGRHAELVPELERLVAEHPFRERLHGQRMLALYRSGRQADALDAYQDARRTLVDELGIDPGPDLQELERAILRQEPSLTLAEPVSRVPVPPTSLVGRELEVAAVSALLAREDVRLLTLTGPGGTGKTRLALEVARGRESPAAFVDLAPVGAPELVPAAIAEALGVAERPEEPLLDTLRAQLADARLLLVLDNFEHVLPAATAVASLLAAAPRLNVLVTSRAALRLAGEHEYAVPPLDEAEAMRLFVERAQAVEPSFTLDGDAPAVAQICRALDGLPLAIELAAARVKVLAPAALLQRLERRLDVLTAGARDLAPRQRTLRATIDWSHDLLPVEEQELFRRLAVFSGGFDVTAAEEVAGGNLDTLASLVDKSLVRRRPPRFTLLETIREYASERLRASGEEHPLRRRHAEHFAAVAEGGDWRYYGGGQAELFAELDADNDNIRAALAWCAAAGENELELRLAGSLHLFWRVRGHVAEGRRWVDAALTRADDAPPALRAKALAAAGALAYRQADWARCRDVFERSLVLYRELGDGNGTARSIAELGNVAVGEGDFAGAEARYAEAAALYRDAGNTANLAQIIANMGAIANLQGDLERGRELQVEALGLQRGLGDDEGLAISLHNIGRADVRRGELDSAAELLAESMEVAGRIDYREVTANCLAGAGEIAAARGNAETAARLFGASEALLDELGAPMDDADALQETIAAVQEELGAERFDVAHGEGAALTPEAAVGEALGVARRSR